MSAVIGVRYECASYATDSVYYKDTTIQLSLLTFLTNPTERPSIILSMSKCRAVARRQRGEHGCSEAPWFEGNLLASFRLLAGHLR